MADRATLGNISIILNAPRYPENIGAAARAAKNMGIGNISVVAPERYDPERIYRMATHAARDTVDRIQLYDSLQEALRRYTYIIGTTARLGKQRQAIFTPPQMARHLIDISFKNQIAIVFGPEDRGLSNEDLALCQAMVNIPTADFSSLNLAQAVMVVCYEIFTAKRDTGNGFTPRLAERQALEAMYTHLKDVLIKISFLNPENPDYWLNNLRRFFDRLPLRAKEVSIIRGICRQINWYGEKRYRDGLNERENDVE